MDSLALVLPRVHPLDDASTKSMARIFSNDDPPKISADIYMVVFKYWLLHHPLLIKLGLISHIWMIVNEIICFFHYIITHVNPKSQEVVTHLDSP